MLDEPRTEGFWAGSCPAPQPPAPLSPPRATPSAFSQPGLIPKVAPGPASTLGLVKPHEVLMGHHLSLSRSLRKRPAPLSLVSPANLLRVPFILSLTKILNSSCTSVSQVLPSPLDGTSQECWTECGSRSEGDPALLSCPGEPIHGLFYSVLGSTTQERQGASGEGQGGHKDDSELERIYDEERQQELGLVSLEKAESGFHQSIQISLPSTEISERGFHQSIQIFQITESRRIKYIGKVVLDH